MSDNSTLAGVSGAGVDAGRAGAVADLVRLSGECALPNWDGYDAEPVSLAAIAWAGGFLTMLPADIPTPDVSADPDGEVSFDWSWNGGGGAVVSVSPTGRLAYAAHSAGRRERGAVQMGGAIPVELTAELRLATAIPTPERCPAVPASSPPNEVGTE